MIELIERKRGIVGAVTDGRRDESEALIQAVVRELRGGVPRRRLRVAGEHRPRGPGSLAGFARGAKPAAC